MVLVVKNPPTKAEDIRDVGLNPGLGRYPGEGNNILLNILFYCKLSQDIEYSSLYNIVGPYF